VDIEDAKRLFVEGPIRVLEVTIEDNQCAVAMQADEFESKDDHIEVLATAERFLDYVNGALFLTDTERRPLRVESGGTVRECGETGIYDRRSVLARISGALRARASISGVLTTADGQSFLLEAAPQGFIETDALAMSVRDKAVAQVLSYLRADPDHPSLYMAYERLKRDVVEAKERWNASGRNGTPPEFPWSDPDEKRFRQSAQPFRHGDQAKWAGKTQQTAMPLLEARGLVSDWVRRWLEWKRTGS
jgi:hypothetical protein